LGKDNSRRRTKIHKYRYQILKIAPHKRGICKYIRTVSPKKPSSANRLITKVFVRSLQKMVFANIKGEYFKRKSDPLIPHNVVLLRAGRRADTPMCKYSVVYSADERVSALRSLLSRKKARSKYAIRNLDREKRIRLMSRHNRKLVGSRNKI